MSKHILFQEKPLLFLDVETTAPRGVGGEVCEVGALLFDRQTLVVTGERNWKLQVQNPLRLTEAQMNWGGYNGYTIAGWADAVPPKEALQELWEFGRGGMPCGWNVSFDRAWLEDTFAACGMPFRDDYPVDHHWLDVMSLMVDHFQSIGQWPAKFSMSDVAEWLGLEKEPKQHRAINGARLAADIYRRYRQLRTS